MYSFRKIFAISVVVALLVSCKAREYGFDSRKIISAQFRDDLANWTWSKKKVADSAANPLAGNAADDKDSVCSIRIYKAIIQEKLVIENAVGEYKLVNESSKKDVIDVKMKGYYHELYFYAIKTKYEQYGLLIAASFNPRAKCIGAGPAYVGYIESGNGDSTFVTEWQVKLKANKEKVVIKGKGADSCVLKFFADGSLFFTDRETVRFTRMIQKTGNKISGAGKMLVYDMDKVFNDPDILLFKYDTTLNYNCDEQADK